MSRSEVVRIQFYNAKTGEMVDLSAEEFDAVLGLTPEMKAHIQATVRWSDEEVDLNG